ncbi:MAG: hypothetical protein LJF04_03445 [Gemmatimonadetes bacterium]|nr:hypothetical protein [Gemmatimonadota bacterium]
MKAFKLIPLLVASELFLPVSARAQTGLWPVSDDGDVRIELARPQPGTFAWLVGDYPSDVWLRGALFIGGQTRAVRGVQVMADVPLAHMSGHVNGCVDAYCSTWVTGDVMGNPLLGLRYGLPGHRLWIEAGYRFPIMGLADPGGSAHDNWQRRVDGYAASAALGAELTSRRSAFMPHTRSASIDVIGQTDAPRGVQVQVRGGFTWISQDSTGTPYGWTDHNTALDLRYDLRASRSIEAASVGVGLVGRRELRRRPDWQCDPQLARHCRDFLEAQISAGYRFGRYAPAIQLRVPVTKVLRNYVKWALGVGFRVSWK